MKKPESRRIEAATLSCLKQEVEALRQALSEQTRRLDELSVRSDHHSGWQEDAQATLDEMGEVLASNGRGGDGPAAYQELVRRVRGVLRRHVPRGAIYLVVSKGDPALLDVSGRIGWHFPRQSEGKYPGFHPAGSLAAIAHLEALRAGGAQYILFPGSAFWWLDHYQGFREHLERRYRVVVRLDGTCQLFSLCETPGSVSGNLSVRMTEIVEAFQARFEREPAILDWRSGVSLATKLPRQNVFDPLETAVESLPYLEGSVDVVVMNAADAVALEEARRVAQGAVVRVDHGANGAGPTVSVEWMKSCPAVQLPAVSLIIPCFNGWALTEACLESLTWTLPAGFGGEILVVDDGSTDDTRARVAAWRRRDRRVRVVRLRRNLGFVDACNRGAKRATGEILVFLNNDVVLLPGWLEPLVRVLREVPEAGAVGGRLILPDGTIQEAGGVVFNDGSAMNFGRGDTDVESPLYSFVREVDYCSAALLATRRSVFEELGGFDPRFRPGYYEDVDYCFRLRERGLRVYYQPESAAVHREGGTGGTDESKGVKRFQVLNRVKFADRWQRALRQQPARPVKLDEATLQTLALRRSTELMEGIR